MKVLLSGSSGFIGKHLLARLARDGHEISLVGRKKESLRAQAPFAQNVWTWDELDSNPDALKGIEAIVHLAGEPVAEKRWSEAQKKKILSSRTATTDTLVRAVERAGSSLKVFLSASAIGIYGAQGEKAITEESATANDFLAEVCKAWEQAALPLEKRARVVHFRIGLVLGHGGGALAKMAPIFSLGLGGNLGNGQQWMSWVHLEDVVQAFAIALSNASFEGAYNLVSPNPERNRDFTKKLAKQMHRPALFPAPTFALKLAFGEMANTLLGSQKVLPQRLLQKSFSFKYPTLESAVAELYPNGYEEELFAMQWVPKKVEEIFPFFTDAKNLEKLTPAFLNFRVLNQSTNSIEKGTIINYRLSLHGIPFRWRTLIESWRENEEFVDTQMFGPYRKWHHTHSFYSVGTGTLLIDRVRFQLPLGVLGWAVAGWKVRNQVSEIFSFRREIIENLYFSKK